MLIAPKNNTTIRIWVQKYFHSDTLIALIARNQFVFYNWNLITILNRFKYSDYLPISKLLDHFPISLFSQFLTLISLTPHHLTYPHFIDFQYFTIMFQSFGNPPEGSRFYRCSLLNRPAFRGWLFVFRCVRPQKSLFMRTRGAFCLFHPQYRPVLRMNRLGDL